MGSQRQWDRHSVNPARHVISAFPSKFKLASISPLLKKPSLPKSELSNFRPISNLNTIGEILERLALARQFPNISISPIFCPLQSAYRKFHSIETSILKLTNDIMETINSGKITILTALDMSAAFDTLDHATRLHRLEHSFGLSALSSLGFAPILQLAHPLLKWTHQFSKLSVDYPPCNLLISLNFPTPPLFVAITLDWR